jgi:hypothetical protein
MHRCWAAAVLTAGVLCALALAASPPAGASGVTAKVSPNKGLVAHQSVTVSGKGLPRASGPNTQTWFVAECTAAVQGHLDPSTDTGHCDLTHAETLKVSRSGTFSTHYRVTTGIVGDGYCGTPSHLTCVLTVATSQGQGTVARITFKSPPPPPS